MKFFEFRPVVQGEMSFKDISYLELWLLFCSAERNHLCNFGRVYPEEQFCEFILNLDLWFRRRCCKIFLIWSSGSPRVQWSGTIYAILVEGIMGNIHLKLFKFGPVVLVLWNHGFPCGTLKPLKS